jgi:hypothetical protein
MSGVDESKEAGSMKSKIVIPLFLMSLSLFFPAGDLAASPVDLGTFTANSLKVSVSPDGSWARIPEDWDGLLNPMSLENDAFSIPDQAASFSFDYELFVAAGNKDYFDFYLGDPSEPVFEMGGRGEFLASGHFVYDLSGLAGPTTVPVIFHLMSDWPSEDGGTGSLVEISNVRVSVIPIPNALLLLGSGLLGLEVVRRKFTGRNMGRWSSRTFRPFWRIFYELTIESRRLEAKNEGSMSWKITV